MAETYDVIVIGGGHNGLALACYLARAGQSVLVLERREIYGGGVISQELIPGFTINTHAMNHHWVHIGPVYKDLELEKYGSEYVFPSAISSHLWKDGRSITVHRDVDRTAREIAQFSQPDARAYRDWVLDMKDAFHLFAKSFFSPPLPASEVLRLYEQLPNGPRVVKHLYMSMADVAEELFVHERTKTFFLGYCLQTLNHYGAKGSGTVPITLIVNQHLSSGNAMAVGGAGTLTRAMARCLEAHGGKVQVKAHVSQVILKGGRAVGLRLENGETLNARKAIASNVEPGQLFLEMIGEDRLEGDFVTQVKNFQWNHFGLFTVNLALHEDVRYRANNPSVNEAYNVVLGREDFEDIKREYRQMEDGIPVSPPCYTVLHPTRFDATQSPPGKHVVAIWQYAPHDLQGGGERWDAIKEAYADECAEHLRSYAPNVTPSAIVGRYVMSPRDLWTTNICMVKGDTMGGRLTQDQMGTLRPFPGLRPYRTPIEGLYLCGPSTHPRGGCHAANGYNCVNVMAADLGIPKWWAKEEKVRRPRAAAGKPTAAKKPAGRKKVAAKRAGTKKATAGASRSTKALKKTAAAKKKAATSKRASAGRRVKPGGAKSAETPEGKRRARTTR
ncbi:MAG: FAD-dependent oxidoreductase [Nitrospinota bacterium]